MSFLIINNLAHRHAVTIQQYYFPYLHPVTI